MKAHQIKVGDTILLFLGCNISCSDVPCKVMSVERDGDKYEFEIEFCGRYAAVSRDYNADEEIKVA